MTSYESHDDMSTTPRPTQTTFNPTTSYGIDDQSNIKTPTRDSFQAFAGQMPPPNAPPSSSSYDTTARSKPSKSSISRSASLRSTQSGTVSTSGEAAGDGDDGSDDSSMSDGRQHKKKKGQRFYCTDYPPCNLSFTRSEHLARHIRKHTGERPFQCHCLRRFSRLDNLRQHAQTVHLNEEIPQDSLAATGTRFQRQIRTDRVRPPGGGRARASTLGSQSSHTKGHSRNISTSSIGSASDLGGLDNSSGSSQQPQQASQHQSLAMGPPPSTPSRGGGLSLDTYGASAAGPDHPYYPYYNQNAGYGSPNSVFSADPNSPLAHSGLQSPIAMVPRGMTWVEPSHARRMSNPSGQIPFQSPSSHGSNNSYMSPFASSNTSTFSNSSMMQSPASSTFSESHQDLASETDLRRRTWHPGTFGGFEQRPATSGLSYYQTPDAPKPMASSQSAAAQNNVRLPGIDSFDHGASKSSTGSGRPMSPMDVDSRHDSQMGSVGNAFDEGQQPLAAPPRRSHHYTQSAPQSLESAAREAQTSMSDSPSTPKKQKRQAWYNGPVNQSYPSHEVQAMSTSPANSSASEAPHTPMTGSMPDLQPAVIHRNGLVEPLAESVSSDHNKVNHVMSASRSLHSTMQPTSPQEYSPNRRSGDMDRLDALVAVATSENQASKAR